MNHKKISVRIFLHLDFHLLCPFLFFHYIEFLEGIPKMLRHCEWQLCFRELQRIVSPMLVDECFLFQWLFRVKKKMAIPPLVYLNNSPVSDQRGQVLARVRVSQICLHFSCKRLCMLILLDFYSIFFLMWVFHLGVSKYLFPHNFCLLVCFWKVYTLIIYTQCQHQMNLHMVNGT